MLCVLVWYWCANHTLCCSFRTGTIYCLLYQSFSCVWKTMRVHLSLSHQSPLLWWIETLQLTVHRLLLSPLCISRFLWLGLPSQTVTLLKMLVYTHPWEPVNYILEVGIAVHWFCVCNHKFSPMIDCFTPPGIEIVNVTVEFLSGNDTYTCLTICAPTHLLPMSL